MELETINKLYLELSQITTATTAREILLQKQLAEARRNAERWDRAAQCARLDQFGGFVVTPDEPAFASEVSLAFTREIDVAIDAAKGER